MSPIDELVPLLKKLRLSGILQTLELRTTQAAEDNLAPAEFACADQQSHHGAMSSHREIAEYRHRSEYSIIVYQLE